MSILGKKVFVLLSLLRESLKNNFSIDTPLGINIKHLYDSVYINTLSLTKLAKTRKLDMHP